MIAQHSQLFDFLESKYTRYHTLEFIETDPVQIPRKFTCKEDIEIAGFLAATIAWGQRKSIITNATRLMQLMENKPFEFLMWAKEHDFERFDKFVHRTFNGSDCLFFLQSLQHIYKNRGGLQTIFVKGFEKDKTIKSAIGEFRKSFFEIPYLHRTTKHVANPEENSSAKRLNMFLRWMVRKESPVDFGIWNEIPTSALMLPLDVHTGTVARNLGLLKRIQNDWKAVEEITSVLRTFDATDPVKYDYALFGTGAFE